MKRIQFVVSYDGTEFCGWAAQTGRRTVQSTLREAVRRVSGEEIEIVGASRTDSGAHALGQVCHFDCGVNIEPKRWARVLNNVLEPKPKPSRVKNKRHWLRLRRFRMKSRLAKLRVMLSDRNKLRASLKRTRWMPKSL